MTFPTEIAIKSGLQDKVGFNAREGLVTFPTRYCDGARTGVTSNWFQCPRGLGDFSHLRPQPRLRPPNRPFQCPRGLGDFSHRAEVEAILTAVTTGFNAREGLVTFPTRHLSSPPGTQRVPCCFNAREGLVTFPTKLSNSLLGNLMPDKFQCPRGLGDFSHCLAGGLVSGHWSQGFNAREGLVTFPTPHPRRPQSLRFTFQCPRGLGDFSHLLG